MWTFITKFTTQYVQIENQIKLIEMDRENFNICVLSNTFSHYNERDLSCHRTLKMYSVTFLSK